MNNKVGILFDLDGTVLFTDELIKETFKRVFEKYKPGYTLTEEELLSFLGPSLEDSFLRYFDAVIGLDDVTITKPNPEGLFKAMEKLDVDKAIMIGDNVSDIEAGKNAGVYTIAVKWSPKGYQKMADLQPDLLIDEMKEIIEFIEKVGK